VYTRRFGAARVSRSDVLGESEGTPRGTYVGNLENVPHIPSGTFDCVVVPNALHLVHDLRVALRTVYRVLRPGGVALITVPGITEVPSDELRARPRWTFTAASMHRLASEVFPGTCLTVDSYGNVLAAVALLHGVSADELSREELDARDEEYPVIIAVRASKPAA